jgi:hypothetical protein
VESSPASASAGRRCPPPRSKSRTPSATWLAAAMPTQRAAAATGFQFHLPFAQARRSRPPAPTTYAHNLPLCPSLSPHGASTPCSGHRLLRARCSRLVARVRPLRPCRPARRGHHRPHVPARQDRRARHRLARAALRRP